MRASPIIPGRGGGLGRPGRAATSGRKAVLVLILALSASLREPAILAQEVAVSVWISAFEQIEDPDPGRWQGDGDYYARVRIGGFPAQRSRVTSGASIEPSWVFTRDVDRGSSPIAIEIAIRDKDGPFNPDDLIDIDPRDGDTDLALQFDLETGQWWGDVPRDQRWSEGDGDTEHFRERVGGERGKVYFAICLCIPSPFDEGPFLKGLIRGVEIPVSEGICTAWGHTAPRTNKVWIHLPLRDERDMPDGSFPLIVYGHGQRDFGEGTPEDNARDYQELTTVLGHLVSHGFIVVTVDLSWVCGGSGGGEGGPFEGRMRLYEDAIAFMLGENERPGSRFYHKIDTRGIGIIGHSMGGSSAIFTGAGDDRIGALALLAPAPISVGEPAPIAAFAPRPVLILYGTLDYFVSPGWNPFLDTYEEASALKYLVSIADGSHFGFTDHISFFDPPESIPREEQQRITKAYLTAFFLYHLEDCWPMERFLTGRASIDGGRVQFYDNRMNYALEHDDDGDELTNLTEIVLGTDLFSADTDLDKVRDDAEVDLLFTDPLRPDTDGDGTPDGVDNCPLTPNPDQADANADGVGDACEEEPAPSCRVVDLTCRPDGAGGVALGWNVEERPDDGCGGCGGLEVWDAVGQALLLSLPEWARSVAIPCEKLPAPTGVLGVVCAGRFGAGEAYCNYVCPWPGPRLDVCEVEQGLLRLGWEKPPAGTCDKLLVLARERGENLAILPGDADRFEVPTQGLPSGVGRICVLCLKEGEEAGEGCCEIASFKRADGNGDGDLDIADAIFTLNVLFGGEKGATCDDALDANDDGRIDIADPIATLGVLFGGGLPLPEPFGTCGLDPSADRLKCGAYPGCGP